MLLTLLNNSGHQYLCLPPHPDKGVEVGFTDPPLAAEAVGDQIAALDPSADCFGRDLQVLCRLPDCHQGWECVFGSGTRISAHGLILHHWSLGCDLCCWKRASVAATAELRQNIHAPYCEPTCGPGPASCRFAVCLEGMRASRSSPGS